jgi:septum site-determining protein MinC
MSQADLLDHPLVFQLKGSMLAITVLELAHNDLERLDWQLAAKVAQAPSFFSNTPLILALDKLPDTEGTLDLRALMALCQRHGLRTLALRASREQDLRAAMALNLPILPPSGTRERPLEPSDTPHSSTAATQAKNSEFIEPIEKAEIAVIAEVKPSKVITSPIRGGQQVYAQGCDLIVLAPVSAGAELLADGNIHVYGPMRGRALAGVQGNLQARIFCQQLGAELISIGGHYKVAEDLRRDPLWDQAVQISLTGELLNITRL